MALVFYGKRRKGIRRKKSDKLHCLLAVEFFNKQKAQRISSPGLDKELNLFVSS